MVGQKLRIGLVLDSVVVPRWVRKVLLELKRAEFIHICATIFSAGLAPQERLSRRVRRSLPHVLYLIYEYLDRRYCNQPNHYLDPVDVSDLLGDTEVVKLSRTSGDVELFPDRDYDTIRSCNLDVIVQLSSHGVLGGIHTFARYGVWSLRQGSGSAERVPTHFWEIYSNNPVVQSSLELLAEGTAGRQVIYQSYSATHPRSLDRSRNEVFWKTSGFILRRLRDLHERGWEHIKLFEANSENQQCGQKYHQSPTNREMVRFLLRLAVRIGKHKLQNHHAFFVAIAPCAAGKVRFDASRYEVIGAPRGRFYADPFLVGTDGVHYLFVEDCDARTGKGVISCMCIRADGTTTKPEVVLKRDYHLSYPFVFEWQGQFYMIPETEQNRTIELYRAAEFPRGWELVKTLFRDVRAVDSTLFEHAGHLWLFTAMSEYGGSLNDELFLFHSDSLFGNWVSHPMNPVVSDVRRARPAGAIFVSEGQIIRPGQDCSRSYGSAISLNRIEALSPIDYCERNVGRIEADWHPGLEATHTINATSSLTAIDGHVPVPRWRISFDGV